MGNNDALTIRPDGNCFCTVCNDFIFFFWNSGMVEIAANCVTSP